MAHLHVAWFVDPQRYPVRWDLVLSGRTLLALAAAAGAAALLFALQRMVGDPNWPRFTFLSKMAVGAPALLAVQGAIALIYSGVQPVLLAPHLHVANGIGGAVIGALEVGVGFAFITGIGDRVASAVLVGLVALTLVLFPPLDALAQLYWVGVAAVIYVIGRQAVAAERPRQAAGFHIPVSPPRAVAALRVLTGLAIVAPALAEKIWNPGIAQAFLDQHPAFNFPRHLLGLDWVTDDRFILAAGIAEFTIGVLLVTGLLTRVVILAMWLPFNLTIPFLPAQELIWHIPVFGIIYFLLVHGADLAPDSRQHSSDGGRRDPTTALR